MSCTIRPAESGDEAGVIAVIRAVYDEYGFTWDADDYHADLYDLQAHYVDQGHDFFVAEVGGLIVGTAALHNFPTVPGLEGLVDVGGFLRIAGCDCSLDRLYVPAAHRRHGIGKDLMAETLAKARTLGKRKMEIWSDKRFVEAHRLYQRLGAVVVGERICHDPDHSPEWGLALAL